MVRVTFRVFGKDGHRQRASFGESFKFGTFGGSAYVECLCEDRTHTNKFVDVVITADSFKRCAYELNSQLSDGIFETCAVGKILIKNIEKGDPGSFKSIKNEIDDVIAVIK